MCDKASGISSIGTEETNLPVDDWENASVILSDNREDVLVDDYEKIVDTEEKEEVDVCECCFVSFVGGNALQQHQKSCAPCEVALRNMGVSNKELFDAVFKIFQQDPELRRKLKIAVLSIIKNGMDHYRIRHSRWLLWWLTTLGLIDLGKSLISMVDCKRLINKNLEESCLVSKVYGWEMDAATNMWMKKFPELLQMRKIDNLDNFERLDTIFQIINSRKKVCGQQTDIRKYDTVHNEQDKEEAAKLKERLWELYAKIPNGLFDGTQNERGRRIVRFLEALKEQRDVCDLPPPSPDRRYDFANWDYTDDELELLIQQIEKLTQKISNFLDRGVKFGDAWREFWEFAKEADCVMFNNVLEIIRNRILEESPKLKPNQKKKFVVELGQLQKCKRKETLLSLIVDIGFVKECQEFFKQ
jgi:hypothetical protein